MTFDAVVVGGGVVGLSTAWHLLQGGLRRVMVLDRGLLSSGATGLGTGSVHTQRWHSTDSALILRSKRLMQDLQERTGGAFRLFPVGRLTLVASNDAATVSTYGQHLREAGVQAVELSPDGLGQRFPGMELSDVGMGLYTKDDGTVYPSALVWALAGLFRDGGGVVWEGCGVSHVAVRESAAVGVALANGDVIETGRVVLATGSWTRRVLQASGMDLALKHAVTHNTIVTVGEEAKWAEVPSLLDGVQGVIAIPRNPGTIMAANSGGEYEAPAATAERVLAKTSVELREEPGAFAGKAAAQSAHVLGQLRHRYRDYDIRGVAGHWAGLLDGTPDSHPYVGPYPSVSGLWVGCGLTGYGVQRGPGVGETLACMALQRRLLVEVDSYRLDRFDPAQDFAVDMHGDNPFAGFRAA